MSLRITDLKIQPESLGDIFLLAEITPAFVYKNGERTQETDGFRYSCVLPKHKMEKISIKVPQQKTPLIDIDTEIPFGTAVLFEGLEVGSYYSGGQVNISARAKNVSMAGAKKNA